ncbi:hypothetical protein EJB05_38447, partial [Eragrostis curvula]
MPGLSSPLAPKGQMKLATAVLLILLLFVLLASSCEARGFRVHGKGSSSKSHLPVGKDAASLKVHVWLTRQAEAKSMVDSPRDDHHMTSTISRMEGVARAPPAGAVPATPVVKVSRRLFQQEDTGFHLDYAGPRTHTPSHN